MITKEKMNYWKTIWHSLIIIIQIPGMWNGNALSFVAAAFLLGMWVMESLNVTNEKVYRKIISIQSQLMNEMAAEFKNHGEESEKSPNLYLVQ